ncbi:hypothetical protein AQJ66_24030 [Streptomyces bungoensis]|uniref:DUF5808 domain-containing protein n=1 Tax=Streptomyces bungoensis TaxID=285568 RepID=A0A101SWQ1_9ACTN|nr:DUF5808 domain-containing protein [Streptomyces bungoensis]KUN81471.1 hypothetical protein AQJ66_24030 [Streptomyces bungoensis]
MNRRLRKNLALIAVGVVAAAVAKELRKPSEARTWTGTVLGVPYDFRLPTPEKIVREYWDPDSDALLTPHAFGVGYGVNLARVVRELSRRRPGR